MQAAFQPTKEIAIATLQARFEKLGPRFEARLAANGSGLCAGSSITFADVVLAEALSAYASWQKGGIENANGAYPADP